MRGGRLLAAAAQGPDPLERLLGAARLALVRAQPHAGPQGRRVAGGPGQQSPGAAHLALPGAALQAIKPLSAPMRAGQDLLSDIARSSSEASDTPVTTLGQHYITHRDLGAGRQWQHLRNMTRVPAGPAPVWAAPAHNSGLGCTRGAPPTHHQPPHQHAGYCWLQGRPPTARPACGGPMPRSCAPLTPRRGPRRMWGARWGPACVHGDGLAGCLQGWQASLPGQAAWMPRTAPSTPAAPTRAPCAA